MKPRLTVFPLLLKKLIVFLIVWIELAHPTPFLKPNCLSEVTRESKKGKRQCSTILETMGFTVIPRKSSGDTLFLNPLNLGIGVVIPRQKSDGTVPMSKNIV